MPHVSLRCLKSPSQVSQVSRSGVSGLSVMCPRSLAQVPQVSLSGA